MLVGAGEDRRGPAGSVGYWRVLVGLFGADAYRCVLVHPSGAVGYHWVLEEPGGAGGCRGCPRCCRWVQGELWGWRDLADLCPPVPGRSSTRKRRFLAAAGAAAVD